MLEIGSLVDGKYKILNEIGHGGMSIVYLAIVERANQTWAIKEVRKNGATKDDIVEQGLVAEMNILKRLNHSHLPRIIDIIDYEDSFLIVMDYIEGVDLDKKLREGPQKWDDVLEWSKQLCDVLAYLHSRTPPIIYRDMKPGNVKLKPDGNVVLFDFGTAREYKSQKAGDDTTCLGTRGYASPEQYGGMGQTDARSDIYCLGATMYHLITGKLPGGPPEYTTPPIRSICPWLPRGGLAGRYVRGLEQIILKCMQLNPANRYQNCAELMYDLENAEKISDLYIRELKQKRNTWLGTAIASVVCAGLAVGLSIGATHSVEKKYEENITKCETLLSSHMSASSENYDRVKENLLSAIDIDPERVEAWLYLTRLYRSDNAITEKERVSVEELWSSHSDKLSANRNHYAQFCYEWGADVFFLYDNNKYEEGEIGGVQNKGKPDAAEKYLRVVIGKDTADPPTDEELKERLITSDLENLLSGTDDEFKLTQYGTGNAESALEFAKTLYSLAAKWTKVDSEGADMYSNNVESSLKSFWDDLEQLADSAKSVSNAFSGANDKWIQCAIYNLTESQLRERFTSLKMEAGIPYEEIYNLSERIRTEAAALENSIQQVTLQDGLRPLFENIRRNCDSVSGMYNSLR